MTNNETRLIILETLAERYADGSVVCRCLCECGQIKIALQKDVLSGHTKSCGCLREETARSLKKSHGGSCTRLYKTWGNMIQRCNNPNNNSYVNYGGRGITICDVWIDSFEEFRDWAETNGYRNDLSIDRIDNDKGYGPDNCRWVTNQEQQANTRNNTNLTLNGESHHISEWARIIGISQSALSHRLRRGWDVTKALMTNGSEVKMD